MSVCGVVDQCIELFQGYTGLGSPIIGGDDAATMSCGADLLRVHGEELQALSESRLLAAIRAKRQCSVSGCTRITMPLASVCRYHLAGSDASMFGACSYPGCTAPVANVKLMGLTCDALCPLHGDSRAMHNSEARKQSANSWMQHYSSMDPHHINTQVITMCEAMVKHYSSESDIFSVVSTSARESEASPPRANVFCEETATQVVPVSTAHAVACAASMVSQIQYMCAAANV